MTPRDCTFRLVGEPQKPVLELCASDTEKSRVANAEKNLPGCDRMMSRVEGMAPADVKIGLAVQAEVTTHNGKGLVVFKAA